MTSEPSTSQMKYIADLARRDWWVALPALQAAYDATEAGQRQGYGLSKSSGIKWLGRAIDRDRASELIDELQAL